MNTLHIAIRTPAPVNQENFFRMGNSIRINYKGMRPYLQEAVIKANELLRAQQFYDNIACLQPFDLADATPRQIADMMQTASLDMNVDLYYSMSPSRNIDGYDDAADPTTIHLNIWRIDRPIGSLCNTLIHACVHAVNHKNSGFTFGHGDAVLEGKENTAPYRIGHMAQHMIAKNDSSLCPILHHEVIDAGKRPIKDYLLAV